MNSKFCGKCGTTNTAQTNFCMQCGENLEIATPQANNYGQASTATPNQWQEPPNYATPANNFSAAQPSFTPPTPNFNAPSSFTPPNAGFQSSQFQHPPMPSTASTYKAGTGSKILSGLGAVVVVLFVILKFGFIFLRAGSLGGIWLVGIVLFFLFIAAVIRLVRR